MNKLNINRFFAKFPFPKLASNIAGFYALLMALTFIFGLVTTALDGVNVFAAENIINIIVSLINIAFYVVISNMFRRSDNNKSEATKAVFLLVFFDFVILAIRMILSGIFLIFFLSPISLYIVAGILYFVFLVLERNKENKNNLKALTILGIIICALSFLSFIFNIYVSISAFATYQNGYLNIIYLIISLFSYLAHFGISVIYLLYPLYIKRETYY